MDASILYLKYTVITLSLTLIFIHIILHLLIVRVSTTYGQRSIKFKCPSLWNSLSLSVRNLALSEFKCKLKDYLLADVN